MIIKSIEKIVWGEEKICESSIALENVSGGIEVLRLFKIKIEIKIR